MSLNIKSFSFENYCLGKKSQRSWGHLKNFGVGGTETFSEQSETQKSCDMAVISTTE